MLESLFKGILNISLYATVVAVAVMFIKLICGKRLSPNFHYGIWFLFLFKLVFPFELKSVLSIFTLFDQIASEPVTEQINTVLPPISTGVFVQSANQPSPNITAEMPAAANGLDLRNVAAVLWFTGIIIMLAALVFSYIKTSKILKRTSKKPDSRLLGILSIYKTELNIRYNIPVYTTGSFGIPFIFGFIKPMIILPVHIYNKLPDEGIKAILLHELMHIKRKDYLVNLILFLLKSIYWFNPIVWLAFAWMKNDSERACDSAVVKEYSTEKRGEYAKALLDVAASVGKRTYIPAISAFTEGNFKERIKNVLKGRKYSFMAASIAVIVFFAAGVILLTGAQAKSETDVAEKVIEGSSKQLNSLLIEKMAESANYLKDIVETEKGNTYSIKDPLQWAEYRVSILANLIALTPRHLGDIQNELVQEQVLSNEQQWKNEYLPFLNRIKQGDIIAFKNNVNDGFQLATEGIRDDNPQKIEQARDIFVKISELLPKMSPSKEVMIEDIKNKLLEGYQQVTSNDADQALDSALITPKYLPKRFQHYGIFMRDNPGIPTKKMIKQLWYDPEKFEVLLVTQSKFSAPDQEGRMIFTDGLEVPGKISDIYPWAKYRNHYEFTKDGISVQGYMLVNDEGNRDEYERILKSLQE